MAQNLTGLEETVGRLGAVFFFDKNTQKITQHFLDINILVIFWNFYQREAPILCV